MMRVLLVSATAFEIAPAKQSLQEIKLRNVDVTICITGVGMVATAFELGRMSGRHFDLAINAGIAGSFGRYQKGEVVNVISDCFSELGAENDKEFLSIDQLGFGEQNLLLKDRFENRFTKTLKEVRGITVNTVHGYEPSIQKIVERHQPDVETMEGAAFVHAANSFGWKAIQLRAISNMVEKRNRGNWEIPAAIQQLNRVIIELIKELDEN